MDVAISVQEVKKCFGEETVLHSVSHDFEEGKIHGIVGNNGSGKTVLMKCICGFLLLKLIVAGEYDGFALLAQPFLRSPICSPPGFLPNMTGVKNLQILASLKRTIREDTIRATIKQVGLDPAMKKPVGKYSLGMRQRLGIAQAIMENPSILILDEPFNGLDKHGVEQMRELIKGLREQGKTIILASHNQLDIDELCDTVCEMDAGIMTVVR